IDSVSGPYNMKWRITNEVEASQFQEVYCFWFSSFVESRFSNSKHLRLEFCRFPLMLSFLFVSLCAQRPLMQKYVPHVCSTGVMVKTTFFVFYADLMNILIPTRKYEFFLVLFFATDEINRNPYLLPNMSLVFSTLVGTCFDTLKTVDMLHSPKYNYMRIPNYECQRTTCDVELAGPLWTTSVKQTTYSTSPKILFGPFHPVLSDKVLFPYVYQIAHKNTCLPHAMISLMLYFTWTWVGLVITDDDEGIQFLSSLREETQRNGICLAFVNVIPDSLPLYTARALIYDEEIMTSSAKVVIIYGEINSTLELSFRRWGYLGVQRIWVTTAQWDVITPMRDFSLDPFHGTVIFEHHHGKVSKFRKFTQTINTFKYPVDISQMRKKWNYFNCSVFKYNCSAMSNSSLNTTLEWLSQHQFHMALSEEGYNLYNAVYAVAHTYHEIIFHQVDSHHLIKHRGIFYDCHQITSLLKKLVFTNPVGELVDMNLREKFCPDYDIFTISNYLQGLILKVKLGEYSFYFPQSQQLRISGDLEWSMGAKPVPTSTCSVTCTPGFRKFHQQDTADCCFDCAWCPENEVSNETDMEECIHCPDDQYSNTVHTHCLQRHVSFLAYGDPLGMTLAFMSLCFSVLTILVLGAFVKYKDTPIVKANNCILSYILLISITLCFLCSLLFIGHPNTVTCILQQTTFGVFFTVAVSTVLAKTITVVLAFKLTTPGRRMRGLLVSGATNFVIPICTLVQLVLCGVWMVTSPPFLDTDIHSEHGNIVIVCNKGSVIAFHFVLAYLGTLALGSFSVAFLARSLPDRFNEAKFLTFSMLVFCSVWVTFLPVYHSTKGKHSLILGNLTENSCFWRIKQNEQDDGDLRANCHFLLFMFPGPMEKDFYTSTIDFRIPTRKYEFFLVLFFATDEINRNPYLLPNMSLVFSTVVGTCLDTLKIIDMLYSPKYKYRKIPNYQCRSTICNVELAGPLWTTSVKQITYSTSPKILFGPFHPVLSDKVLFPYVYQIAHKNTCLPHAMISLMLYFTWTWIGLVITNDDEGIEFLLVLREETKRNGICLAFVNVIPDSMALYTARALIYDERIMTSSAKVVIIYGEMNSTLELSFRRWRYLGVQRIWVTTAQWDVITPMRDFSLDPFHGTVTFEHHHGKVSKFKKFMQTINTSKYPADISQMRKKWNYFNCSVLKYNYSAMNHCSLNTTMERLSQHQFDMVFSEEGYNLYNAVYAVAHTYHEILFHQIDSPTLAKFRGFFYDCHQINSLLKKMVFSNPVGEKVDMNLRGKLCKEYDIYTIWNFPQRLGLKVKLGEYSSYFQQGQQLHISEDLEWSMGAMPVPTSTCSVTCTPGFRKFHQQETADCCFDCAWCPENEVSNETERERGPKMK
ncbi:vomeronasal type-2 receptor 116-like isoform X1, partial [Sigmodon hispidus]